jgi:very-short-patch-repair endonuclease
MLELLNKGYLVDPQVGTSGYRIDLGIRHVSLPGSYICGIECDGVTYHSSETARDRDRLRQAVLESRGWHIIRIWSTDWFKERFEQIQRMVDFIENARLNRIEQSEDEKKILENIKNDEDCNDILEGPINGERNTLNSLYEHNYRRPIIQPYKMCQLTECLNQVNDPTLGIYTQALTGVVYSEGPIHWDFAFTRVSSFWWRRRGVRIEFLLKYTLEHALAKDLFKQQGTFLYKEGQAIQVRNREGLRLTADYICPEELEAAIILVVEAAKMIPREKLILEIIAILGVVRTPVSKTAINKSIQTLFDKKMLGEGSTGLTRM